jgi:hypothetical protein
MFNRNRAALSNLETYSHMTTAESELINGLFERLKSAGGAGRDAAAEQLIQQRVAAQPDAPYLLAQTVLVQEHALQNAQMKINQLQQQLAAQQQGQGAGGGFLSGLFHRDPSTPPPLPTYPTTAAMAPSAGGGFLRSALSTAAGVAGGSLLFQGIEDLLGHRSGAFGSMLGGGMGSGFGGGFMPPENVEVTNNYYEGNAGGGNSFIPSGGGVVDNSFQSPDPGAATGNDPGLGVDWGSNIDPGPGIDPNAGIDLSSFDPGGGSDPGSMAV